MKFNLYVPCTVWQMCGLGTMEKALYGILLRYAGQKAYCWPAQAKLADELGCSVSSIRAYLKTLQKYALLTIRKTGYSSATYFLTAPSASNDGVKNFSKGCVNSAGGCVNSTHEIYTKKIKDNIPPLPPTASSSAPDPQVPPHGGRGRDFLAANAAFEQLWQVYPKQQAKEFARAAWHSLWRKALLPSLDQLAGAIRRCSASASWQREQGRFVPLLANWLRGQRWLDDDASATAADPQITTEERQIVEHYSKEEEKRKAAQAEKSAQLRPLFEQFAARFEGDASPFAFGAWAYLHEKGVTLRAQDVPEDAVPLGIVKFLKGVISQPQQFMTV